MSTDERLLYETRMRNRQAAIAATAGVLLLVAAVIQGLGPQPKVSELTIDLLNAHKRFPLDIVAGVVNMIGMFAVASTLAYLHGAIKSRQESYSPIIRNLAIAGGVTAGLAGAVYAVVISVKAQDFANGTTQTYPFAHHLTGGTAFQVLPLISLLGALLFAVSFVMISLGAMRVGLLTRFQGYLGVFAGVLVLFQITPVPIVQSYWLLALAYLLSGRWPSGVPPAWRSGQAEPWPSSQQTRERRIRAAGGRPAKPAPVPAAETVGTSAGRTRSSTPKRKRKKRR